MRGPECPGQYDANPLIVSAICKQLCGTGQGDTISAGKRNQTWAKNEGTDNMPLSGEAIRLMNYIDDVSVTLRRVLAAAATLSDEERVRVADHWKAAQPSVTEVLAALEPR